MKLTQLSLLVAVFLCPLLSISQSGSPFIENKGQVVDFNEQFHPEVKYYHSHRDASVYFQSDRLVYHFADIEQLDLARYENDKTALEDARRNQKATYHRMDMVFVNASGDFGISPGKQIQGVTHYYVSKRNGIRDVRSFETIRYQNIYPNIDAVFYSTQNGLKYDLILKSGANIQDIKLKFEGAIAKLENRKLILKTSLKDIVEEIPLSFINEDSKNEVEVNYILNSDGTIGFQLKNNIVYSTLTIDPVLEWSSYFNMSNGTDAMYNIANHLDNDGHYYSYGMAQNSASNYPVVNPGGSYTTAANGSADAYFVKFNADRQLVWSTYLGGSGYDEIYDGDIITTRGNTLHLVGERITTGAPFTYCSTKFLGPLQ
jgi:hypothetical protein